MIDISGIGYWVYTSLIAQLAWWLIAPIVCLAAILFIMHRENKSKHYVNYENIWAPFFIVGILWFVFGGLFAMIAQPWSNVDHAVENTVLEQLKTQGYSEVNLQGFNSRPNTAFYAVKDGELQEFIIIKLPNETNKFKVAKI